MSAQKPEALRSLYEITGNVADANTVLINRGELCRLRQVDLAHEWWLEKTEWVQASSQEGDLGQHRADIIKQRLDRMTAQRDELLEALKAMIEVHGVTQAYADKNIEIPQSWVDVSDIARAAIAKAIG